MKHDAAEKAHQVEEKSKEVLHAVEGERFPLGFVFVLGQRANFVEKVSAAAASTKETVVAAEKVAEEKLSAAKEVVAGRKRT